MGSSAINIGGSVTVDAKSDSGACIGSGNRGTIGAISIGGSAKVTATSGAGAGIGSGQSGNIGAISIGGNATVTASSQYNGKGIGAGESGTAGTPTYGNGTTITVTPNATITKTDISDPTSSLSTPSAPSSGPEYGWTAVNSNGSAEYKQLTNIAGYTLDSDSKSIAFTDVVGGDAIITLTGIKTTKGITVDDNNVVTVNAANLNAENVTIDGEGYTLALADDVPISETVSDGSKYDWTAADEGKFTCRQLTQTAGYVLESGDKSITYKDAVGNPVFTLEGIKSTEGITVDNNVVIIDAANLDGKTVTLNGDGYTRALASDDLKPQTTAAAFDSEFNYKSASNTAGYEVDEGGKSITYIASVDATTLFTLSGVKNTDNITVDGTNVIVNAGSLNQQNVEFTKNEGNYTLQLGADVEKPKNATDLIIITNDAATEGTFTISADGIYQFDANFTGTVKFTEDAKNVKLIGAGSQLSNVSIDASAVTDANLWIEDLNITSNELKNLIKFGSGTDNYLIVEGENTLVNTASNVNFNQALINVGGGLNIVGDEGSYLTAQLTGIITSGAAIGSNRGQKLSSSAINIGGAVNVTATVTRNEKSRGAGIGSGQNGSIGDISIGGTAKVNASSYYGTSIGKGQDGTESNITCGKGTTVTRTGTPIADNQKSDNVTADSLTVPTMPFAEATINLKEFNNSTATFQKLTKTDGYELADDKKSITYMAQVAPDQFTLTGIKSADGITVKDGVVTISKDNLIDDPTVGSTVEITNEISGGNYTLALASEVPQAVIAKGDPIAIEGTAFTIDADGVYQFDANFTGTVTLGANAKNVKIIGAGSQLSNVNIDASAVENINLWIKDLNITSNEFKNLIKFGSGTNNYLTVEGTNNLKNTASDGDFNQALINVGGGLNIIGDGSLTAELSGAESYGAAIGTDFKESCGDINIGGFVNLNASSNYSGAGIGSGNGGKIGDISIGGTATVTASAQNGAQGIGKGVGDKTSTSEITYGTKTTVKNNNVDIPDAQKSENVTADNLTPQDDPINFVYHWTDVTEGASTFSKVNKTAGYTLDTDNKSSRYNSADTTDMLTVNNIATTNGNPLSTDGATLTADDITTVTVLVKSGATSADAVKFKINNSLYTPKALNATTPENVIKTFDVTDATDDTAINL